jgi:hypothetical protein
MMASKMVRSERVIFIILKLDSLTNPDALRQIVRCTLVHPNEEVVLVPLPTALHLSVKIIHLLQVLQIVAHPK